MSIEEFEKTEFTSCRTVKTRGEKKAVRTSSNRKKSGKKRTKLTAFWESESPFHMAPRILPISPKVASGFLALTSGLFSLQKTMKGEAWRFSPSFFSFLGLAAFVVFSALGAILSKGCGKEIETACGRLVS